MRLFFSAHLDDAILSCGATIAKLTRIGIDVTVATTFTGAPTNLPPLARRLHDFWRLNNGIADRIREDVGACRAVGATARHFDFLDAIYRMDGDESPLYPEVEQLYKGPSPGDESLLGEMKLCFDRLLAELEPDVVYAPAAVGTHVDHVLTRRAFEYVAQRATGRSRMAYLYEDLPYGCRARHSAGWPRAEVEIFHVDEIDWSRKRAAIAQYASQSEMLWGEGDGTEELRSHAQAISDESAYCERFWRFA